MSSVAKCALFKMHYTGIYMNTLKVYYLAYCGFNPH